MGFCVDYAFMISPVREKVGCDFLANSVSLNVLEHQIHWRSFDESIPGFPVECE
jgi:hypothetical protein